MLTQATAQLSRCTELVIKSISCQAAWPRFSIRRGEILSFETSSNLSCDSMFNANNLQNSLIELGLGPDQHIFDQLYAAYSEDGRHYHNTSHVAELLTQFKTVRHIAEFPAEIEVAIWFHDAIYDTRASDNEEQSAAWAESYLSGCGAPPKSISRIVEMIIATKTHESDLSDALIMLDIDLGILGSEPHVFERYDQAIRKEYHWVPDEAYRQGRVQILSTFYDRNRIFRTDHFHSRLNANARRNLKTKIDELST